MCIHMICSLEHNTECDMNECPSFTGVCRTCNITRLGIIHVMLLQLRSMPPDDLLPIEQLVETERLLGKISKILLIRHRS